MINKKKLVTSLVTSSLLATFTLGSFADAHTYIINNEDINKNAQESSIGTLKQNNFKQSTIDSMKPKSLQSFQEDKVFKAPKEKTPITERTRKSEQSLSNSKLNDVRSFTTVNMRTNANERTAAKLKYNGKKYKCMGSR